MKYVYFEDENRIFGQTAASLKIRILNGLYLQNGKASEAQIVSGLYWEYTCFIGNVN